MRVVLAMVVAVAAVVVGGCTIETNPDVITVTVTPDPTTSPVTTTPETTTAPVTTTLPPVATTSDPPFIAPAPPPDAAPPNTADLPTIGTSVPMPDVVCMNLQLAQDTIQSAGVFYSRSVDATGAGRLQVVDRNWIVVAQQPAPGVLIVEGEAVLSVVRESEPNEC